MATFYELPLANDFPYFVVNSSGASVPASGYQLFLYSTGSSTKITSYTDSTGGTPNANPVLLGSTGLPQSGSNVVGIWLSQGQTVKAVFTSSTDTDPPTSPIWTRDFGANPPGINDPTANITVNSEWIASGLTPTFVSTTSFTVPGDQTANFQVDRRLKSSNSGGTVYSTIKTSSFGASVTTVTVVNDSGVLDSGLSAVSYALLSATNRSVPPINTLADQTDPSKKLTFTLSGLPAATTKTVNASAPENICNGRLTLTTGTPITTTDVTAATSVFFTPYAGNRIATFNGNFWNISTFSEKTLSVPASTVQMYDIFIVDGTLSLESLAWTNDTTRATTLTTQDGILVKTGDATRRYLGSFRTTGSSGQTEDSVTKRYVWNYYNRVARPMSKGDTTDSWQYTTATFRQANNSTANQLEVVIGFSEDPVIVQAFGAASNTTGTVNVITGIGIDSSTANSAQINPSSSTGSANITGMPSAKYNGFPGVGKHDLRWLEWSTAAGTTTWLGDNGSVGQTGITGEIKG